MTMDRYKRYEPFFGAWRLTGELAADGHRQLFDIACTGPDGTRRAVLAAVSIDRKNSDDKQRMAETVNAIQMLTGLKGAPCILAYKEHAVQAWPDKGGWDILVRLQPCTPLSLYRARHGLTRPQLLRLGADIAHALQACHDAGLCHGNVQEDAFYAAGDGTFLLGGFTLARPLAAGAGEAAADIRALGAALQRLAAQDLPAADPRLNEILRRACSADAAERWPDASAFAAALQALPDDLPARPDPAAPVPAARPQPVSRARQAAKTPGPAVISSQPASARPAAAKAPAPERRRMRRWPLFLAAGLLLVLAFLMLAPHTDSQTAAGEPTPTPEPPAPTAAPEPTLSPEEAEAAAREERIGQVLATMQGICTGAAPQVTDPATWAEAGKALMDRLEADPYYQEWGFTASAAAFAAGGDGETKRAAMTAAINQWQDAAGVALPDQYPYLIAVNRAASTVTVYTPDAEGRYTVPYMAMVCSGGPGTPTGFWFTPIRYQWRALVGPCYGQNATRIWDSYLFHSVPYYTQHKDDVEYDQYNQLGTPASLGCIRLAVVDVKWIFDNCPLGTPVVIYDDENDPGPMGKPGTIYTDPANEEMRGWDPTDPDPANPWGDEYLPGTAIRSDAAWAEYNSAMADGRWNGTINVTDLQGWSTDSATVGTRG